MRQSIGLSLFGPISLVMAFLMCGYGKHGLLWRPLPYEVTADAHRERFPNLPAPPRERSA